MTRKILVISPHPDDETLGCCGSLLRHKRDGDQINWVIMTVMWEPLFSPSVAAKRDAEIEAVANAYGMASTQILPFPTTRLDEQPLAEVIGKLRPAIQSIDADIVYLPHRGDAHSDHTVTFDAAWGILKPFSKHVVPEIYCYEALSSTNLAPPTAERAFLPQAYMDISDFIEEKLRILSTFASEIYPPPYARSLEAVRALARLRGAAVGLNYAEAFMVMRQIR